MMSVICAVFCSTLKIEIIFKIVYKDGVIVDTSNSTYISFNFRFKEDTHMCQTSPLKTLVARAHPKEAYSSVKADV